MNYAPSVRDVSIRAEAGECVDCLQETDMNRWDFLYAAGTLVSLFVPVFIAIFSAQLTGQRRKAARAKRIAAYRNSPDSSLLRLNY